MIKYFNLYYILINSEVSDIILVNIYKRGINND